MRDHHVERLKMLSLVRHDGQVPCASLDMRAAVSLARRIAVTTYLIA